MIPVFFSAKHGYLIDLSFLKKDYFIYEYFNVSHRFKGLWFWDFFIVTTFFCFIQYIPVAIELWKKPREFFRYMKNSFAVSAGLTFVTFAGFFGSLLSSKVYFETTADEIKTDEKKNFLQRYFVQNKNVCLIEFILGIIFLIVFFVTLNVWVLPVAGAMLLSFAMNNVSWNNKTLQVFVAIPFLFLLLIFAVILLLLLDLRILPPPKYQIYTV